MYTILTREIERGGGGGERGGKRESGRGRERGLTAKACAYFEHWYFNNKASQFSPVYN